jgi:hypothetical protein
MGFDRSALLAEIGGRSGSRLVSNGKALLHDMTRPALFRLP